MITIQTSMDEATALDLFWSQVRAGEDRMALLQAFAEVVVPRPNDWDPKLIRAEVRYQPRVACGGAVILFADSCFSCYTASRPLDWHHVILISNGGSNTPRNRLAICYHCHRRVHPWLPIERPRQPHGGDWIAVSDLIARYTPRRKKDTA